jgi:hypothetical protein
MKFRLRWKWVCEVINYKLRKLRCFAIKDKIQLLQSISDVEICLTDTQLHTGKKMFSNHQIQPRVCACVRACVRAWRVGEL